MNKRLFFIIVVVFVLPPFFLTAQTAAELETVLECPAVTCAQAAWFVLGSCGLTVSSQEAAFEQAMANGWFPKRASADGLINMGTLSFLMMKAFDLKGGLMYLIMPGPRYAFRSMVSRSVIQGAADPAMNVSGERFLLILGNVLSAAGDES